jgi:hypothetical protein
MKRLDSMLLKVFLYGLPAIIVFAAFSYSYSLGIVNHANIYLKLLMLDPALL